MINHLPYSDTPTFTPEGDTARVSAQQTHTAQKLVTLVRNAVPPLVLFPEDTEPLEEPEWMTVKVIGPEPAPSEADIRDATLQARAALHQHAKYRRCA